MPNAKGWHTKEEVLETGLPYWTGKRWTVEPYAFAVLLTKSRCKESGIPILRNGHEKPSAFRYAAAAGTGTGDNKHRYFPLYDRTDVFVSGDIAIDRLYPHEMMGKLSKD